MCKRTCLLTETHCGGYCSFLAMLVSFCIKIYIYYITIFQRVFSKIVLEFLFFAASNERKRNEIV